MRRTVRKITALLLTLVMAISLLPGSALGAGKADVPTRISAAKQDKTLRILAVGNSFSVDSLQYLYQMAKSAGYELVIGNLYHKKCTLREHWDSLRNDGNGYTYYKISSDTSGAWSAQSNKSIAYGVADEPWDIITLQQASSQSGVSSSYYSVKQWKCEKIGTSVSLPKQSDATTLTANTAATMEQEPVSADTGESQPEAGPLTEPMERSVPEEEADASAPVEFEEEADGSSSADSSTQEPEEPVTSEPTPTPTPTPERVEQTITCDVPSWGESSSVSLKATAQTALTYTSSNADVATVDADGRVTFLRSGRVTITITAAQSEEYYGAQCKVTMSCERMNLTTSLQEALKKQCSNSNVRFGWNITWAYAERSEWNGAEGFAKAYQSNYGADQMTMYRAITDAVTDVVAPIGGFSVYIPTGTAIQNLRSSYVGDKLNRDGVHLSYSLGRYTAAMTWAAALGIDITKITYLPTGSDAVSSLDVAAVRTSVTNALKTPLAVTSSQDKTAPTMENNTEHLTLSNGADGIQLTWEKTPNATGYRIWRKTGDGSFKKIAELVGDKTTYVDTSVKQKSNTTYTYSIRAISGAVNGPYPPYVAPANQRQSILRLASAGATATNEKTGVKLTWKKVTGAKGYRIYRESSSGERKLLKTVKNTVTTYTDKKVENQNGKTYTYTVQPYSGDQNGPAEGVSVTRLTGVTLKKASKSGSNIKLTWSRNSKAKGYQIYRKTGSGSWVKVKTITKNSTLTYTDKSVKRGKKYTYKVRAYKDTSVSQFSGTKTVKR